MRDTQLDEKVVNGEKRTTWTLLSFFGILSLAYISLTIDHVEKRTIPDPINYIFLVG